MMDRGEEWRDEMDNAAGGERTRKGQEGESSL